MSISRRPRPGHHSHYQGYYTPHLSHSLYYNPTANLSGSQLNRHLAHAAADLLAQGDGRYGYARPGYLHDGYAHDPYEEFALALAQQYPPHLGLPPHPYEAPYLPYDDDPYYHASPSGRLHAPPPRPTWY
ncbi:MAG: hypothetical protein INR71_07375, partial [Terriglobus roseus]|nr:hypothetical protein [Terriglobus roseus]